jgi:uncharacterized protein YktA (UPF0223 family)
MKKLILLLLTLLVGITLFACTPKDPDSIPEYSEKTMLLLAENGTTSVQIIRSEVLTGQANEIRQAVKIMQSIQEKTGIEISIGTDYTGAYGTPEMPCEILVGKTERPESAQAMEKLNATDAEYLICAIGQKICIVGKNDRGIQAGTAAFIDQYLYFKENKLYTSKTLEAQGVFTVGENVYFKVPAAAGDRPSRYDESVAVACVQGIMNRESPHKVYLDSNEETAGWLEVLSEEGRWLEDVEWLELTGFEELLKLSKDYIKTVIIWDPDVPATVNVACTMAGVEDGVAMTEAMYDKYKSVLNSNVVVKDLVGQFTGDVTGSAKIDAYVWAIENYLEKGLCSTDYLCSYIDSYSFRQSGNMSYTVVRDWGVYHRAFVYDLSPWGDEAPLDDPDQEIGLDKKTLLRIYTYMLNATKDTAPFEVCGFFEHQKYSQAGGNSGSIHGTVKTEWEYAALMTPYNGYHNTCIDAAYNESFHGLYDGAQQLDNNRPDEEIELEKGVVYLCFFMGDYDSTHPVYRYLKQAWDDPRRGDMPFAWAINPNLIETYPDLFEYYYETATPNDYFVSDASAAGYFMPTQVPDELWPKILEHNLKYFNRTDMSIAPMVLDRKDMDADDLKWMTQIAPDGIGTVSQNKTFLYEDTVITALLGGGYDRYDPVVGAKNLEKVVNTQFTKSNSGASLCMLRCVWSTPSIMCRMVELYQEANPDKEVVVVDIYNYFQLVKQDLEWK